MSQANIDRLATLEQVYPLDAFASDAAQNGSAVDEFVRGIRILCAPDAAGEFAFERATQQIGEAGIAVFLAPYRREDRLVTAGHDGLRGGYEAFLGDIIAAARQFGFKPDETPGRDEPRLRGLRQ